MKRIGIFWDYENCPLPAMSTGYAIAGNIREAARALGDEISTFKAYVDVHLESHSKAVHQGELQASGVTLVHCPHNNKKEVADRVLVVDLMVFALESQAPSAIVLITGDRDFTYAISVLRMKGHEVFIIYPPGTRTYHGLKLLTNGQLNWASILERKGSTLEFQNSAPSYRHVSANSDNDKATHPKKTSTPQKNSRSHPIVYSLHSSPNDASPTPLSIVLGKARQRRARKRSVLTVAANDKSLPYGDSPVEDSACNITQHSSGQSNNDVSRFQETSLGSQSQVAPHRSLSVELIERPDVPMYSASCEDLKESAVETLENLIPASVKTSAIERCSLLVEILQGEQARGQSSTPCDVLDVLLKRANPNIYQDVGVHGIKEYIELAQEANLVYYSDIYWDNRRGWVRLRNAHQDYIGRESNMGHLASISQYFPFVLAESSSLSERALAKHTRFSVAESHPHAASRHTQAPSVESRFAPLMEVMRDLRTRGVFRLRSSKLIKKLREQMVIGHATGKRLDAYIKSARSSGILCDGGTGNDYIELHPDYH